MKVNQTWTAAAVAVGLTAAAGGLIIRAQAQNGVKSQSAPRCNVSPVTAIKNALVKVPGRPLQANFEFDEGKWVYGVIIVNGKVLKEVLVDPMTGKAGAVETVTPEDEAKEVQSELNQAIGAPAAHAQKPNKK